MFHSGDTNQTVQGKSCTSGTAKCIAVTAHRHSALPDDRSTTIYSHVSTALFPVHSKADCN
ncbi:hypothetical protein TYRP_007985 [Tyrophagus putrescentiae]|nr:hypothetical protein TYRP_007985 [Tyrophagus putrescentiae]